MKQAFIATEEICAVKRAHKCGVKAALGIIAPWACKFVRVCGGYHAFESWADFETWKKQK